ncbi:aminopeptidase C [Hoylesella marshii]|uniref:Aminopeptidase n=1 Tax=Hoylesella marshii DSM 16973 = JCM 13450 TaxID=862515 RepID=E0NU87_9BACT|nr:C1 family peptidase [Hoylesella marshii]EFM01354.1 peptidase C1-like family [Hoylesella marshii DSM 16973 = JCM 13450]
MNKKLLIAGVCLAMAGFVCAQTKRGGISPQMLSEIQKSVANGTADKALFNAMASNSIDNLARNHANSGAVDGYFSVETKKQNIQDQKSSGRCWMFSGMNVLRSDFALRTDSLTLEYSHVYLAFWDQLEKANLFLQGVIETAKKPIDDPKVRFFFKAPLNDGGTFCGIIDLADKYGLVPKEAMPETYSAENTSRMSRLISSKLREYGLQLRRMVGEGRKADAINAEKTKMLSTVYRMLALSLGEPVKTFSYAFKNKDGKAVTPLKTYTPQSFFKETVGESLDGRYIMLMNDPRRPYYKTYEIEYDRHTYDGHNWKYLNLPMDEVAEVAVASLKAGHKMYSSYDVGKQLDRTRGYSDLDNYDYGTLFGVKFGMNKAERIDTYDSGSTHAMTLTAVDLDANGKPVKWKVENSWGATNGHNGCIVMTGRWFNEYMFRLVVDTRFVSEKIRTMAEQKPTMLTQDDPLFSLDD